MLRSMVAEQRLEQRDERKNRSMDGERKEIWGGGGANLLFFLKGLHLLLVPDELLLHQQVVLDSLLLQELQAALGVRGD